MRSARRIPDADVRDVASFRPGLEEAHGSAVPTIVAVSRKYSGYLDYYRSLEMDAVDLSHPLRVITPTLDGDVLAVLALADSTFTSGQLHRVLPQYSADGIRKVLRRLTGQGIVLADRAGNSYLFRLNRSHLAAGPIRALAELRKMLLARIEQALATWNPTPVYAAVFGSAARGDMRADSDIDLLLIRPDDCDRPRWDESVADLTTTVVSWTGNDTRVLEFSESEIRQFGKDEKVLADVRDQGLTVAGSSAWFRSVTGTREPKSAAK
jgi:hypothetical protein